MNNQETITVTIVREHDKLCILEELLDHDTELKQLVSEYIDLCINKQPKMPCFHKIKNKVNAIIPLAKIMKLCNSIAFDKPIKIEIPVNEYTHNVIKYLNEAYIPLFV